jgi:thiamine biosynthesis lipoprotein
MGKMYSPTLMLKSMSAVLSAAAPSVATVPAQPAGRAGAFAVRSGAPAAAWAHASDSGRWVVGDEAIMGTAIRVEFWLDASHDARAGDAAVAAVMAEMHRIDAAMSPFKPASELSRINRDAAHQPVRVGDEMFALLARALEFSRATDGAFDITFAAAGGLYDYRLGIAPGAAELAAARAAIGWRHLVLDRDAQTVRFAKPGMRIDLGGFAKGHAVDNGAAILRRMGIRHAIVTAGGDSRIVGDRRGRPWTIGIRDPRRPGEVVALLPLEDVALSTSGDYERYFEADGVRHHHVIDPRTGKSPDHVHSVSIVAPDGLTSEALSKCVFVLGVERGLQYVESIPGADGVVVDSAGRLHFTTGLLDDGLRSAQ